VAGDQPATPKFESPLPHRRQGVIDLGGHPAIWHTCKRAAGQARLPDTTALPNFV